MYSDIISVVMNHKIKSLKHKEHISICTLDILVSDSECVQNVVQKFKLITF